MEKSFGWRGVETEYTFKPVMRIADLTGFSVRAGNEFFDIRIGAAYSDSECWNPVPSMKKVVVWGYQDGNPHPVLEQQYEKLEEVRKIADDLPENHPVALAIWSLEDEYAARFA